MSITHGTYHGAQRHRRAGERPCSLRAVADASYQRCWRWKRVGRPRYSWRDRDRHLSWEEKVLHGIRLDASLAADVGLPLDQVLAAIRDGFAASWTVQHGEPT